jgi:hypothetical protein
MTVFVERGSFPGTRIETWGTRLLEKARAALDNLNKGD